MHSTATSNENRKNSARRPVIGICGHSAQVRVAVFDRRVTFVPQEFVDQVDAAGAAPVLLPPLPGIEQAVPRLDGLVLLAGPDVDPARYAAERHPKVVRTDPGRDAAELALLAAALDSGVPVLGVCRGLQLLNILRDGTIHQHLPDVLGHEDHLPEAGAFGSQQVRLQPGSRVAEFLGGTSATVPCRHHQAVDRVGTGLTATAWAPDGTIEALEALDHPFAVGVQWHAEEGPGAGPFLALAEAARARRREAVA
ncbi:gamma-glutamyl-gamma-aminobutyrate hydrolase family protein [Actinomadura luteofluorescens]|uniref:gamma-glutamyl-gamma-aminobutyrate hydrolase family protein n=1 Tax=Actinomadura luteofluorescens TaxID=46163 RepID=UPI0034787C87